MPTPTNKQKTSWLNVLIGSIAATIAVTITMMISGTNILHALGTMILGADASSNLQYVAGSVIHLGTGIVYGVMYILFFASVSQWNRLTKGVIFGTVLTTIALTTMPIMASIISGNSSSANPCFSGQNSCNPCGMKMHNTCDPCMMKSSNPCAMKKHNPCDAKMANACNPCNTKSNNPCAMKKHNPCDVFTKKTPNPCGPGSQTSNQNHSLQMHSPEKSWQTKNPNPCMQANPCGGGTSGANVYAGAISLINHIIFGLVMVFFIRVQKAK